MNLDANFRVYSPYIIEGRWYREGINIANQRCHKTGGSSKDIDDLKSRIKELERLIQARDIHIIQENSRWVREDGEDVIYITKSDGTEVRISRSRATFVVQVTGSLQDGDHEVQGGSNNFREGTEATVVASPKTGRTFVGWYKGDNRVSTEANYTLTVTQNVTLEARYARSEYSITINPVEGTTITARLNGSPVQGTFSARHGDTLSLEATTQSTHIFNGWTGVPDNVSKTSRTLDFHIEGPMTISTNTDEARASWSVTTHLGENADKITGDLNGSGSPNSSTDISVAVRDNHPDHYIASVSPYGETPNTREWSKSIQLGDGGSRTEIKVTLGLYSRISITSQVELSGSNMSRIDDKYIFKGIPGQAIQISRTGQENGKIVVRGNSTVETTNKQFELTLPAGGTDNYTLEFSPQTFLTVEGRQFEIVEGAARVVLPIEGRKKANGILIRDELGATISKHEESGKVIFTATGLPQRNLIGDVTYHWKYPNISTPNGTVNILTPDIDKNTYYPDKTIRISASPNENYEFDKWGDNDKGSERDVRLSADESLFSPVFVEVTPKAYEFYAVHEGYHGGLAYYQDGNKFNWSNQHGAIDTIEGSKAVVFNETNARVLAENPSGWFVKLYAVEAPYEITKVEVDQAGWGPLRIHEDYVKRDWHRTTFQKDGKTYNAIFHDGKNAHNSTNGVRVFYRKP